MKAFGYLTDITAHYSDGSILELERYECDSFDQVVGSITHKRSHYATIVKDHISSDDGVSIVIRSFKLNDYGIPKLVFLEECDVNGIWSGWSEI